MAFTALVCMKLINCQQHEVQIFFFFISLLQKSVLMYVKCAQKCTVWLLLCQFQWDSQQVLNLIYPVSSETDGKM